MLKKSITFAHANSDQFIKFTIINHPLALFASFLLKLFDLDIVIFFVLFFRRDTLISAYFHTYRLTTGLKRMTAPIF